MTAARIEPRFVERVWGSHDLAPLFGPRPAKIGEVWYPAGDLLVKFLFTTEALSVQVHPGDEYAARVEASKGKTEMWHVLEAKPGARLAAGFQKPIAVAEARRAAELGTIEGMLAWWNPQAGDTYFLPAGTVHALGAGLVVCEIQQTSDVTYRLFDYGRGRELHLDRGFEVADFTPLSAQVQPSSLGDGGSLLVECNYFRVERWQVDAKLGFAPGTLAILLSGTGAVDGERTEPGDVWQFQDEGEFRGCATILRVRG